MAQRPRQPAKRASKAAKRAAKKPARKTAVASRISRKPAKPAKKPSAAASRTATAPKAPRPPRIAPRRQPETLRIRRISPSLVCNDLARSLAWYCDVLGFVIEDRWMHEGRMIGAELRAGSVVFMLSQDDFAKGRDRTKGEGHRLFCETVQDVDAIARGIKDRGWALTHDPITHWGQREFGILDPDGFRITIWARA